MPSPDPDLQRYLQNVVGRHSQLTVASVDVYDTWAELPWDPDLQPPDPMPAGQVALIGLREFTAAEVAFVALPAGADRAMIAANLAAAVLRARTKFRHKPIDT